jgi:acyl carrier protein
MDLFTEIKEIIVKELALEEAAVVSAAHLQDDLGADSLALLNLTEIIGKRYGIEIMGDDLVEIENVGELVSLVESKISSKS